MRQHTLFDIISEHIFALDDEGLRLLIARLCKADLRLRGLPVSAVLHGGNQIAADGGIDVRIELPADTEISRFIPRPATGSQAKADDMPASEIRPGYPSHPLEKSTACEADNPDEFAAAGLD